MATEKTLESSEAMWLEDQLVERAGDPRPLYRQYGEDDGHLAAIGHVGEPGPGAVWIAWCAGCGESWYGAAGQIDRLSSAIDASGGSDLSIPRPTYMTYEEAKGWARDHRSQYGLAWQDWWPSVDIRAEAESDTGARQGWDRAPR